MTIRATAMDDSKKVKLDESFRLSKIGDVNLYSMPMRGEEGTIQIPSVTHCNVDATAEVSEGGSLLICCLPTGAQRQRLYVLLRVPKVWTDGEVD